MLPADATVLLESRSGPLAAALELRGPRSVAVFFDLRESDWPFQVSFPVFLNNAIRWLCSGSESGSEGEWVRPGDPVVFPSAREVRVRRPDGPVAPATREGEGPWTFTATELTGVYEAEVDGKALPIAVNLLSPEESDTRPRRSIDLPGGLVEARVGTSAVSREYWPWLVLVAIAALSVEWWIYHRRAV